MKLEETKLANGMFKIAPSDIEKPRHLTPAEKIAKENRDLLLTAKADLRQPVCWKCDRRPATTWVREVGFDFKGDKADPINHVAISSADYPGAVPGFCQFCIGFGPAELAEKVYFDRPEMYWGVRPTRWFVLFTDGTKQADRIVTIDPTGALPTIIEEHINSGT